MEPRGESAPLDPAQ
ncbi:unnamed protein product [Linum tenue]|uniref:Uncharacterized protein n=1 Tax=Linum tenue TaxID=586396 RepID=A0AAV0GWQ8_9ROSI|nr:unnamed protein product [Linum tenue]